MNKLNLKSKNVFLILTLVGIISFSSCKKDDTVEPSENETTYTENGNIVTVKDKGKGTGNKTFTSDKIWMLDGMVFVNAGQTLTIEPGTVIKGKPGEGENASALIVARGAKINAIGTAQNPIIFTAEADDLNGSVSKTDKGLWGGVIILGNAKINTVPNKMNIEGIPTTETRGEYGGDDDSDNSGIFKYVSIRHGGTNIGADNEINGLSFGAVGSGTVIDYVEVFANNDDGFEFFGGTVQTKHLISAYCKDDAFDYDQGFRGKAQFWLAVQDPSIGDRLGELDGADDPEDGTPFGIPEIYNATFIGHNTEGSKTLTFRANAGGKWYNSIFVNQQKGVDIELKENLDAETSYKRLTSGDLKIENNIFYDIADATNQGVFKINAKDGVSVDDAQTADDYLQNYILNAGNTFNDPGISYPSSGTLNPVPTGNVTENLSTYQSNFFTQVNYKGAFDPNAQNWANGWTLLFE